MAAQTSNPAPRSAKKLPVAEATPSVSSGLYHNPFFGFVYKIPFGWVDRTAEMRQGDAGPDANRPREGRGSPRRSSSGLLKPLETR